MAQILQQVLPPEKPAEAGRRKTGSDASDSVQPASRSPAILPPDADFDPRSATVVTGLRHPATSRSDSDDLGESHGAVRQSPQDPEEALQAGGSRADRSVLEHLMFACCLEDAGYEAAEEAFAALEHTFFDWNEVRVTSLSELSEVMARLPDPRVAGNRIKRHPARHLRGQLFLRPGRQTEEEPRPHGEMAGETRRRHEVHRRLRGPVGLGRPPNPHRRRHHGRPAHPRPGDRQGRGRGRRAGAGAGGGQVQGDRVRLAAAPTRRRVYGQSVFARRPRHPAANRAGRQGSLPAAPAGPGHAEGAGRGAGQDRAGGKSAAAKPAPRQGTAAGGRRKPAARARGAFRPRPKPAAAAEPAAGTGKASPAAGDGAAAAETPPARNARRPKPPRKRPRRRDSPNANHDKVRCGKRSAVHIHALSLAAHRNARAAFSRVRPAAGRSGCLRWRPSWPAAWSCSPASAERSPPAWPTRFREGCSRARSSPSCPSSRRPRPIATARRRRRCSPPAAHTKQRGEFRQALRMYQRALRLDPKLSRHRAGRSSRWPMTLGQDDVAVRYLKWTDPADDDPELLQDLGRCDGGTRRSCRGRDTAGTCAGRAKRRKGRRRDASVLHMRTRPALLAAGTISEGCRPFRPRDAAIENPRQFGLKRGRPEETAGQAGETYDLIGDCFLRADRLQEATAAFQKADAESPNAGLLEFNLARVAARSGKPAEALARLEKALPLAPATSQGPTPTNCWPRC